MKHTQKISPVEYVPLRKANRHPVWRFIEERPCPQFRVQLLDVGQHRIVSCRQLHVIHQTVSLDFSNDPVPEAHA